MPPFTLSGILEHKGRLPGLPGSAGPIGSAQGSPAFLSILMGSREEVRQTSWRRSGAPALTRLIAPSPQSCPSPACVGPECRAGK